MKRNLKILLVLLLFVGTNITTYYFVNKDKERYIKENSQINREEIIKLISMELSVANALLKTSQKPIEDKNDIFTTINEVADIRDDENSTLQALEAALSLIRNKIAWFIESE